MAFPEQGEHEAQVKRGNGPGIGALLKASRLRIGEDLHNISVVLCIRNVYLEAIEDGRFEALPGPTYATGFIRAYAEYLGLDSDEVMRRFKADPSVDANKTELIYPEPTLEPNIPGGATVFIGIVIAVVAYGAWYVNTSKEGFLVELISPVPEQLAALVPGRKEPTADSGAPAKETAVSTGENPAAPESKVTTGTVPVREAGPEAQLITETTAETALETTTEVSPETPTVREAGPEVQTADPQEAAWASIALALQSSAAGGAAPAETTAAAEPEPNTETAPETAPGPASPAESASVEPAAATTTDQSSEAAELAAAPPSTVREARPKARTAGESAAPVEPPTAPSNVPEDMIPEAQQSVGRATGTPEPSPETASKPASTRPSETVAARSPGTQTASEAAGAEQAAVPSAAAGDDNRIVVRAKTNSWIQIRNDIGKEFLVTRLLRAGNSYAVPNRRGLKLSTGNAGALEILVDGKAVPSIGDEGIVRRGVELDADKLKAGTAVSE